MRSVTENAEDTVELAGRAFRLAVAALEEARRRVVLPVGMVDLTHHIDIATMHLTAANEQLAAVVGTDDPEAEPDGQR